MAVMISYQLRTLWEASKEMIPFHKPIRDKPGVLQLAIPRHCGTSLSLLSTLFRWRQWGGYSSVCSYQLLCYLSTEQCYYDT
jgi:hypothetical protein